MIKGLGAFKSNLESVRPFSSTGYTKRDIAIPTVVDYRKYMLPVRDQGNRPTCAAHTFSSIMEFQYMRTDADFRYNSPMYIYNLKEGEGDGMYGSDLERIGSNYGICSEVEFPFINSNWGVKPDEETISLGKTCKIKDMVVLNSIEDVKKFLTFYGPCYIAFPVYNGSDRFWNQRDGEDFAGGHAVAMVGFDKTGFILRNSWGKSWGEEGHTMFPYDDFGKHWEILGFINNKPYGPLIENQKCCSIV